MNQELTNNIFFLYDYSVVKFLTSCKDFKDPVKYFTNLDKALLPFFYYFDSLTNEKKERFLGCTLFLDGNKKFKMLLVTQSSSIEFRAKWVQRLGIQISKFNDFSKESFFIYSTINYSKEVSTSEGK